MTHAAGGDDDPMRIGGVDRTRAAEGAHEADAVEAEATHGVDAATASSTANIEAVAQGLQTGAIDATEAKAQLIDQAVQAQLPPDADPALVAEIRAEVEALLESDPVLQSLLRP